MRTFRREDWQAAQHAWDGYSDEWRPWRHQAADRGMIWPPAGTAYDSWDDEEPSQRALLIRAIRDTPDLLHRSIATSRSWGQVIGKLIRQRDEWRELTQLEDDYTQRRRLEEEADGRQSTMALKAIVDRIAAS